MLLHDIRNPIFVKNILRPIRVGLGPSSIIVALYTSAMQITQHKQLYIVDLIRAIFAMMVLVSTFFAGVVFRPDNLESYNLIQHTNLNPLPFISRLVKKFGRAQRKEGVELKAVHGVMNLLSILMSLLILLSYMFI